MKQLLLIPILGLALAAPAQASALPSISTDVQANPKKPIKKATTKRLTAAQVTARIALARQLYSDGKYSAALKQLDPVLKAYPEHSEALYLKEYCDERIDELRAEAQRAYDAAEAEGTVSAMQEFINSYPRSQLCEKAKLKQQEFRRKEAEQQTWLSYKNQGTKQALIDYLKTSAAPAYASEARAMLKAIETDEAYQALGDTASIPALEAFATAHPGTKYDDPIKQRIALLKARTAAQEGKLGEAYDLYTAYINSIDDEDVTLSSTDQALFAKAKQYRDYLSVMENGTAADLLQFNNTHGTDSPYYKQVADRYARLAIRTASPADFDAIRACASQPETKTYVEDIIAQKEEQLRLEEIERRKQARKDWWHRRVTAGWHVITIDGMHTYMSFGTGFRLRLGRYTDAINFIFGADYSHIITKTGGFVRDRNQSYSGPKANTVCGQVTVPYGIRFNMGKKTDDVRYFIGVFGESGFKVAGSDSHLEKGGLHSKTLALMPELGISGNHFDVSIYYKHYLKGKGIFCPNYPGNSENDGNHRIGTSITWFF